MVKLASPEEVGSHSLPNGTVVSTSMSDRFKPDGSAETVSGSGTQLIVRSDNGSPQRTLEFIPATSRVSITG